MVSDRLRMGGSGVAAMMDLKCKNGGEMLGWWSEVFVCFLQQTKSHSVRPGRVHKGPLSLYS